MTNKFVTFLEEVGRDFKNGFKKLYPVIQEGTQLAVLAAPEVTALNPLIGAVFTTVATTALSIEQKFAAMGQQSGTGPQKLAQATTILAPVVMQALTALGKQADIPTVQNYISAVVQFLNSIPATTASVAAPAPAPTPAPTPAVAPAK